MTPHCHIDDIFNPDTYVREIEYRFRLRAGRPANVKEGVLDYARLYAGRFPIAVRMARAVRKGEYRFTPMTKRKAYIQGKARWLFQAIPMDTVVVGAVAKILNRQVEAVLSPRVFSYRKGRSYVDILTGLHAYFREHRRTVTDRKQRGLYVLRRDVSGYGESIPTHDKSRLWSLLATALTEAPGFSTVHPFWRLLTAVLRPEFIDIDGVKKQFDRGTPTGSPIQPAVNNLYLLDMDRALAAIPGGFYARYGDDLIFVHPDVRTAMDVSRYMDEQIDGLELRMSEDKKGNFYMTAPARPGVDWPRARAVSHVEHLGCRLGFDGGISLKRDKARALQQDVRRRLSYSLRLLQTEHPDVRLQVACDVVNQALDPTHPLCQRSAPLLLHVVNDRVQLKHLDYLLALEIARAVSGNRSVKAFREVPWRKLRQRFGLRSLVLSRNQMGKEKGVHEGD